jgi:hypothetical protein
MRLTKPATSKSNALPLDQRALPIKEKGTRLRLVALIAFYYIRACALVFRHACVTIKNKTNQTVLNLKHIELLLF